MTSPVITDEMVNKFNGTYYCAGRYGEGNVEAIRKGLAAAAPMILEEAAKAAYPDPLYMAGNDRDENGNLAPGSPYDRGRYDAAKDIRALKGGK